MKSLMFFFFSENKSEQKKKLKGTVKEKCKGVLYETWESQELNDTFKTSIWCSCLEKLKLNRIYMKIPINTILCKCCSIKKIIFNQYETNLKATISHRNLRISGLLLLLLFFLFCILIDIIDNLLTSPELQLMQYNCHVIQTEITWPSILHCHWLKFRWRNTDYMYYIFRENVRRSIQFDRKHFEMKHIFSLSEYIRIYTIHTHL